MKSLEERNSRSASRVPRREVTHGSGGAQFHPSGAVGAGEGRFRKESRCRTPKGSREEKLPT